jgi:hypothetical protein
MTGFGVHSYRLLVPEERRCPGNAGVGRLAGVAAVAALAVIVSVGNRGVHHPAVHFCCAYTPARLAAGDWWTLLGSALLVAHLHLIGSNSALMVGVILPYALRQGSRRTVTAFFTGHVVPTLAVAAVVLPLAAWGWHPAEVLRVRTDVGASAGVAGVAGALAASMGRRWFGATLLGAFAAFFAVNLVLFHGLSDVQHLIALAVGAFLGRRWERAALRPFHRRFMASPAG